MCSQFKVTGNLHNKFSHTLTMIGDLFLCNNKFTFGLIGTAVPLAARIRKDTLFIFPM